MRSTTGPFTSEYLRRILHNRLVALGDISQGDVFIYELGLCRGNARVDLAVVGDELHGYEIKSERDSLRRLNAQAEFYNRVFDRVTLVCTDKHTGKALSIIPSWWGVLRVVPTTQDPRIEFVRLGRRNPSRDIRAMAEFLWSDEASALLEQRNAARGLRGKPRAALWDRICELFSIDEVAASVRSHLKATAESRGRPAIP